MKKRVVLCVPNEKPKGVLVGSWEQLIELIYQGSRQEERGYSTSRINTNGLTCVYRTDDWRSQPNNIYYRSDYSWGSSRPNTHQGTIAFCKRDTVEYDESCLLSMTEQDLEQLADSLEIRSERSDINRIAVMSVATMQQRMSGRGERPRLTRDRESPLTPEAIQAFADSVHVFRPSESVVREVPLPFNADQPIVLEPRQWEYRAVQPQTPVVPSGAVEVSTWYDEAVETGRDVQARELFRQLEERRQLFGTPVSEGEEEEVTF